MAQEGLSYSGIAPSGLRGEIMTDILPYITSCRAGRDGWVKCSERMPDEENYYLTYSNAGIDVTYFDGKIFSDEHAAHWMPLPAAPGGQDS